MRAPAKRSAGLPVRGKWRSVICCIAAFMEQEGLGFEQKKKKSLALLSNASCWSVPETYGVSIHAILEHRGMTAAREPRPARYARTRTVFGLLPWMLAAPPTRVASGCKHVLHGGVAVPAALLMQGRDLPNPCRAQPYVHSLQRVLGPPLRGEAQLPHSSW